MPSSFLELQGSIRLARPETVPVSSSQLRFACDVPISAARFRVTWLLDSDFDSFACLPFYVFRVTVHLHPKDK